jgi:hypothetical protein
MTTSYTSGHTTRQRRVRFPTNHSLGALFVRARQANGYAFWEPCGAAQGLVLVPNDKELRLNVNGQASMDLAPLRALHADDLQYLQLSGTAVSDTGLSHLRNLTGLRVLWLYDTRISDNGLLHLHGLTNLRILNVRSTLVSTRGINALQEILPQCEIRRAWQ